MKLEEHFMMMAIKVEITISILSKEKARDTVLDLQLLNMLP
jgi:hypothetical protein